MGGILSALPLYLLSLPVVLIALSVHESAHAYAAYKLGDPTARNLGRITLNPAKHFDLLGFLCMVLVRFGWAKPVPIVSRNFRNPRRDMALTGAAGPISNLLLALLSFLILRIVIMFLPSMYEMGGELLAATDSVGFLVVALIVYLLFLGVMMNLTLAIFNLIPIPPFDGSRIFYVFLPTKWYFGIMKYERYIMLAFFIFLIAFESRINILGNITGAIFDGLFRVTGTGVTEYNLMAYMINHISNLLTLG